VLALWELIRRYMEEGPEAVMPYVDHIMDIDGRRETWWEGVQMLQASAPILPVNLIVGIARQICMATCKFPKFPEEIDAECAYDEDDPYLVDAMHWTEKLMEAEENR
jgi:hypothetical protein